MLIQARFALDEEAKVEKLELKFCFHNILQIFSSMDYSAIVVWFFHKSAKAGWRTMKDLTSIKTFLNSTTHKIRHMHREANLSANFLANENSVDL